MDEPLGDTAVTGNRVAQGLSTYFGRPIKLIGCAGQKIGDNQGYTSSILRLELKYAEDVDDRQSLPPTIILKSLNLRAVDSMIDKMDVPVDKDEMADFVTVMHKLECDAYRALADSRPLPLPLVYEAVECHGREMGLILMEDLSRRSSIIGDIGKTLTLQQMYEAADAMACLHAWCLTTDADWKSSFEPFDSDRRKAQFEPWMDNMKHTFANVKQAYPNVFDDFPVDALNRYLAFGSALNVMAEHKKVLPEVIVHGDFYANNLMFEKIQLDGQQHVGHKLVALIDWQLCHRGQSMEDFARILTLNLDTETRRRDTPLVLRRYYDSLLGKVGSERLTCTFDQLLHVYNEHFIMASCFFVLCLTWLQNLFVSAVGEERERLRHVLFLRCRGVYEDMKELLKDPRYHS